jgi:hypothetical protein
MSFDQTQALEEGWCIIENSDGILEIQRDDAAQAKMLATDDDAANFVAIAASENSAYHVEALRYIAERNAATLEHGETLVLENVDFELLEKQRKSLQKLLWTIRGPLGGRQRLPATVTPEDVENLEGLENMLDCWSDAQRREERLES